MQYNLQILEDKPDLSRWTLKYEVLGRDVEFSWLARNMTVSICYYKADISLYVNIHWHYSVCQPIKNQKIHWRSLEGLPNR